MWIAFFVLAMAAIATSAAITLYKWECRRSARGMIHRIAPHREFHALLIVPCKGAEVGQEDNLRSLFQQRGVEYELRFVVESECDAAVPVIAKLRREYPHIRSQLIVAGRAIDSGQKVHNLRAATENLPAHVDVLAFADADARPAPDWLASLMFRLDQPIVGARTGYRWLIPQRWSFANLLAYSINSSSAGLYSRHHFNLVWGGAWAIRRAVFDEIGIRDAWVGTLSDDLVASRALRGAGLRIEFEPRCMTASPVDMTVREMYEFVRRQFLVVRRYAPKHWWATLGASTLLQATLWGSVAATLWLAMLGQAFWWTAVVGCTLYSLAAVRGWFAQSTFGRHLDRFETSLTRLRLCDIWLGPLLGIAGLLAMLSSSLGSSMNWRGIRYHIAPGGRILLLGRSMRGSYIAMTHDHDTEHPATIPFDAARRAA